MSLLEFLDGISRPAMQGGMAIAQKRYWLKKRAVCCTVRWPAQTAKGARIGLSLERKIIGTKQKRNNKHVKTQTCFPHFHFSSETLRRDILEQLMLSSEYFHVLVADCTLPRHSLTATDDTYNDTPAMRYSTLSNN